MKPVFLRFAGLHSYIDDQQIDFTELTQAGVFGIFGPTGSGKSTILDAITLALYGTVERAPKKTKEGIINQYSNQAAVSFTFELQGAAGAHRYRVERTFRRGKTADSAEAAQARLLEVACGEPGREETLHVLADKASSVSTAVEEVLGLTVTDFCRAVVLPQGKFAEFLSLQGGERRSMLQRLFGLELYGDRLLQQVKRQLQSDESALASLRARISDLGAAAPEDLQKAAEMARTAEIAKDDAAKLAALADKDFAVWQRVWTCQNELDTVQGKMAELANNESVTQALELELAVADKAEQVRSPLAQSVAAEAELRAAESSLEIERGNAEKSAALFEAARSQRVNTEKIWAEESPALYSRQADLRRAADKEQTLRQVQTQLTAKHDEVVAVQARLAHLSDRQKQYEEQAQQVGNDLTQTRSEAAQRVVDPVLRERVAAAVGAMKSVTVAEQQLAKEQRECVATQAAVQAAELLLKQGKGVADSTGTALASIQERKVKHCQSKPWDEQELQFRRRSWQEDSRLVGQLRLTWVPLRAAIDNENRVVGELAEAEKMLAQATKNYEQAIAGERAAKDALSLAEAALLKAQHADMAATLAAHLGSGIPCPVCGSTDHPRLAVASAAEQTTQLTKAIADQNAVLANAEKALQLAIAAKTNAEANVKNLQDTLTRTRSEKAQLATQLITLRAKLPQVWRELELDDLEKALSQAEVSLSEHEAALQQWQQIMQQIDAELRDITASAAEADKQFTAASVKAEHARSQHTQAMNRVETAAEQVKLERATLLQLCGEFSVEDISRLHEQFARWDREAATLRAQEAELAAREKEISAQLTECRRQVEMIRQAEAQVKADCQALQRQCDDLRHEIEALTGPGVAVQTALAAVEARLAELVGERSKAAEYEAQANEMHQQALQQCAAVEQRYKTALQRCRELVNDLAAALVNNGFASAEAATQALRSAEERELLKRRISAFRQEQERWRQEQVRLETELAGRHLTSEEWQEWQARVAEAHAARDAALEAAAVAVSAYADVQQRHIRWVELTAQEASLSDRVGRLQDLSSLFRGNAFVDFLAEQQLQQVAFAASAHLGALTRYRYALEVASDGTFIVRDDTAGGYRRAVHTLSGGETFLTSLALALALSSQIQLRGRYPLQFFFLDEGFGALDQELLDIAMTALERLHLAQLHVGVISHVPELRNRIMRRLVVTPAVPGERGSRVATDQA